MIRYYVLAALATAFCLLAPSNAGVKGQREPAVLVERAESDQVVQVERGNPDRREICLTFDDGPHPIATPMILDALANAHVPAAFFVVGREVEERPELVRRMIADGHEVGNHSHTHARFDRLNSDQIAAELQRCDDAVAGATGRRMTLFRPPGMRYTPIALKQIARFGYVTIDWTTAARDFTAVIPDPATGNLEIETPAPDEIARRVTDSVEPGGIILLHNTPSTAQAIPRIVANLRARGFEFISLQQMLRRTKDPLEVSANPALGEPKPVLRRGDRPLIAP